MRRSPSRRSFGWLVTVAVLGILLSSLVRATEADNPNTSAIEVYTHAGVPIDTLSSDVLRSIFAMRLNRWPDGTPIRVFVLADKHPMHRQFSKQVLGLFPYQLRQIWDQAVFTGTGEAPSEVVDQKQMLEQLVNTPGAIGYLIGSGQIKGVKRVAQQ